MTEKIAKGLAASYLTKHNKVIVTSDYGVYVDSDESVIREYAERMKLDVFVFVNEIGPVEEDKPKGKKTK